MDEITIFYNYTPNQGSEAYFIPRPNEGTSFQQTFYNYLTRAGERAFRKLNATTYKIYEDYIDLPEIYPTDLTTVTYIAIKKTNGYYFYFVDKVIPIRQGARCYTTLDNWATYIGGAKINNLRVTKSSYNLSSPVGSSQRVLYWTDKVSIDLGHRDYLGAFTGTQNGREIPRKNLCVYATIKHHVARSISESLEEIHTYQFTNDYGDTPAGFKKLIRVVSSIFQIQASSGDGSAELLHLYIYPQGLEKVTAGITFTGLFEGQRVSITGIELKPSVSDYDITLRNAEFGTPTIPDVVQLTWLGRDIYLGTKYDGLKLPYFVGNFTVRFRVIVNNNGIQFLVQADQEVREITSSFTITVVANTATLNNSEQIAKSLNTMAGLSNGMFQMIAGGAGIVSGGLQIASSITNAVNNNNGTYIGGGDALITFNDIIEEGSGDYLWLCIYGTYTNNYYAEQIINRYGAYCNYIPAWNTELTDLLINSLPLLTNDPEPFYIQCGSSIANIPSEAAEDISTRLSEGVRLRYII